MIIQKNKIKKNIVDLTLSLSEALNVINEVDKKILLVKNKKNKLVGSITDGDIRRAILKKYDFNIPINLIMNKNFRYTTKKLTERFLEIKLKKERVDFLPLLNNQLKIKGIYTHSNFVKTKRKKNYIFLFAGGKGKRLMPLTEKVPKSMIKIKKIPLLERIVRIFIRQGFYRFVISINHFGNQIQKHFGNGKDFDCEIFYVKEKKFLGTAGSLSMFKIKTSEPIITMNSDLVTNINYHNLLNHHKKNKSDITMCIKHANFELPFGEVHSKNFRIKKNVEKPNKFFFINTGIYVLNFNLIKFISKNQKVMMTDFINNLIEKNKKIFAFPIFEEWHDIGNIKDLNKVKQNKLI